MIRVKFLRVDKGLSQRRIAQYTNVHQPVLSLVEAGRLVPTRAELERLALFFGYEHDPDRLLDHVSCAPLGDGAEYRDAQREQGR